MSVDDKQSRSGRGAGSMRFGVIGNLKAHAGAQGERASVLEFGPQFALQAKQNVSFDAPVVCDIAGRTLDDPNSDVAELSSPPDRRTSLALMCGRWNVVPLGDAEWNTVNLHPVH